MRTFIIATIALLTSRSYAISNIDLRNVCLEKGKEKIVAIAKSKGCDIDVDTISVSSIDNRWYNNLKYVWYEVDVDKSCEASGKINTEVEYFYLANSCDGELIPSLGLFDKCLDIGRRKLERKAKIHIGCNIDQKSIKGTSIGDGLFSHSKFVWYKAKSDQNCRKQISFRVNVKYSFGRCGDGSSSSSSLFNECLDVGKQKIIAAAKSKGCDINANNIENGGIDERWYNPYKYILYKVKVDPSCSSSGKIQKMVQYSFGNCSSDAVESTNSHPDKPREFGKDIERNDENQRRQHVPSNSSSQ
jgi:hypothetical protein